MHSHKKYSIGYVVGSRKGEIVSGPAPLYGKKVVTSPSLVLHDMAIETPEHDPAVLERYLADLYHLFLQRMTKMINDEQVDLTEQKVMTSMLQEIFKVKEMLVEEVEVE